MRVCESPHSEFFLFGYTVIFWSHITIYIYMRLYLILLSLFFIAIPLHPERMEDPPRPDGSLQQ